MKTQLIEICQNIPYPYETAVFEALDAWCAKWATDAAGKAFVAYFRRTWGGDRRAFAAACAPALIAVTTNALERFNKAQKEGQEWQLQQLGPFVVELKDKINLLAYTDKLPENQDKPFDFGKLDYNTVHKVASRSYAKVTVKMGGKDVEVICLPDDVSASDVKQKSETQLTAWADEQVKTLTEGYRMRKDEILDVYLVRIKRTRFLRPLAEDERVDERVFLSCTCGVYNKGMLCPHAVAVGSKEGGPALDRSKLPLGASVGDSMKHGKPKGRPANDPQKCLSRFKAAKRQKL